MGRHEVIPGARQFRVPAFLLHPGADYVGRHWPEPGHWRWRMETATPQASPWALIGFRLNQERAA